MMVYISHFLEVDSRSENYNRNVLFFSQGYGNCLPNSNSFSVISATLPFNTSIYFRFIYILLRMVCQAAFLEEAGLLFSSFNNFLM